MSTRTVPEALRGIVRFKEQRVFRCWYYCEACDDAEFTDEMLVVSHSWCPHCGAKCEPDTVDELFEDRPEFDVDEMEID